MAAAYVGILLPPALFAAGAVALIVRHAWVGALAFFVGFAWFCLHGWHRFHGRWTFSEIKVPDLRRTLKE